MNIVFTLLLAVAIGYIVRSRGTAVVAYVLADCFLFTFQTAFLLMKWVDGDDHAFGPRGRDWSNEQTLQFFSYFVVNAVIVAVGVGLVLAGHRIRAHRTSRRDVVAVD